jgi:hypothetical protein
MTMEGFVMPIWLVPTWQDPALCAERKRTSLLDAIEGNTLSGLRLSPVETMVHSFGRVGRATPCPYIIFDFIAHNLLYVL